MEPPLFQAFFHFIFLLFRGDLGPGMGGQRDLRKIGRDKPTFEKSTELPLIFHPYRATTRYGKVIFDFQALFTARNIGH